MDPRLPWLHSDSPEVLADSSSRPFWQAVADGHLVVQRCDRCSGVYFPPRPMCPACLNHGNLVWEGTSRTGTVYSFTIAHYEMVPGFTPPYPIVSIDLDAPVGARLIAHLEGTNVADLHIGMRVELTAPVMTKGAPCPVFRAL